MERYDLRFGGNSACPIYAETSQPMGMEIGGQDDEYGEPAGALVFKDTNGAPLFRLALDHVGTSTAPFAPPSEYGLVVTLFTPITFRPPPHPR